jgi:hypothetical protein
MASRHCLPTRRGVLAGIAAAIAATVPRARAADMPVAVGAIRWDAWQSPGTIPTLAVERALTPPQWRHRLPFFARINPDDSVAIDGGTQPIMDAEIALARRAGLGFWAFVSYPRESHMSRGLHLYLSSTRRQSLRFCLVSELVQWGTARDRETPVLDWQLDLLRHPDHQRVAGNRPLYFLGFLTDQLIAERWGNTQTLHAAIARFRARAIASGAGDPYIVLMARPDPGLRLVVELGADAISAYAISAGDRQAPFAALAHATEQRWNDYAAAGLEVIPTVMSGWDRRPRVQNPVPWEAWQRPGAGMDSYYAAPTPRELAAHLSRALAWMAERPHAAAARAALIYAWNENDEGGWLVPTLPFDDARIEAVRSVLCAAGCR